MTHALRRLALRVWCGAFPLFALPGSTDDSDACAFFGSDAIAHVRTALRLKLQETRLIAQTRRSTVTHYEELLALTEQYKTLVVALLRFVTMASSDTDLLPYTPLFLGWGDADVRTERLVGRDRRLLYAVPIDVVLTYVLLAQLHALHAEALVDQGLALESDAMVAAAETAWRASTRAWNRAASVATATLSMWMTGDPQLAPLVKLLTTVATQSTVLAHGAQLHRAATRITSWMLLDETIERLARHAAVCARYAFTVATRAREHASELDDSSLSRQLVWLVHAYVIRWKAAVYSYEQTTFALDVQPEIALHFGDLVQRSERLPPLPEVSNRRDAYFTRICQELQQQHAAQLSDGLAHKAALLAQCQRQRGPLWTLLPLSRELRDEFTTITPLDNLFEDENDGDETESADEPEISVDAIRAHINDFKAHTVHEATRSVAAESVRAIDEREAIKSNPPPEKPKPRLLPRPSSAEPTTSSDWVTMRVGNDVLHFEPLPTPSPSARPPRPLTAGATPDRVASPLKTRPSSSPSYLSTANKKRTELTWVPTRASCALCERRFVRANLPGVVVMKRIFDLRRKWGMVLLDSRKFSAASALYGRAHVCVLCHDILTFDEEVEKEAPLDDVGCLIRHRIELENRQRPPSSDELLLDVAVDKRARQSSTNFGLVARNAVQAEALRTAHTKEEFQPWWEVDLGNYYVVHSIKIWLREDHGLSSHTSSQSPHRKMGIDVPSTAIPMRPQGTSLLNLGLYPLHLSVSMKTGVDRDLDDIVASAVSTHCIRDDVGQPLTWTTPPNARGRFVRLQSESTAFLHIEKVQVFIAQELPTATASLKRAQARSTLKRAAFRASVISKKLATSETVKSPSPVKGFASAFVDPELAEKRRMSRLYMKFKNLLDARSKYVTQEEQEERET